MNLNQDTPSERLFSYGTLRYESVQLATFGRTLSGKADELCGYSLSMVTIHDPDVVATSGDTLHPILHYTGKQSDCVEGMVFYVSLEELKRADEYEVADYRRVQVQLESGEEAWVYVSVEALNT
ncbi:AIG2-like family protein [Legionella rubrilucens]|uniref:AIG2-like family protein n=1 Tax=Legionella rubrilucens TaxID=458 RepID=A0A0W0Y188_9GAMM|nr:gamma-glutamylcyclotransferase family protein [Legionella rubrilucens]KTD50570.1 AIG2-like family protein [Legionella rubrilucens]